MKSFRIESKMTRIRSRMERRRAIFARIQLCYLLYCLPVGTVLANGLLRGSTERSLFDYHFEPYYTDQSWAFFAMNLLGVWRKGYTGKSVSVRINDKTWGFTNPEWAQQGRLFDDNRNGDDNYRCGDRKNGYTNRKVGMIERGTAITSIVGADGTNDYCGTGIAPGTQLSFCNFDPKFTNPSVLVHNIDSQTIKNGMIILDTVDISINAFAHDGCSGKARKFPELHREGEQDYGSYAPFEAMDPLDMLKQIADRNCPFEKYYNDEHSKGEDPCMSCLGTDFETVEGEDKRDNVFNPTPTLIKNDRNDKRDEPKKNKLPSNVTNIEEARKPKQITKACAQSVRTYCKRNFLREEALCTRWLDATTKGNTCRFKNNVGKENHSALEKGAKEGRNGLGIVYLFAAGDAHGEGDNVNFQAYPKSRYVMTVGAAKWMASMDSRNGGESMKGVHSSYSTGGSSLFVVAPGGDYDSDLEPVGVAGSRPGDCGGLGHSTRFATAMVGGVVALMLEANDQLTYRDVRAIVAKTAKPVIVEDKQGNNKDDTFETNAAGVGYSDLYGFGLIDAGAAVSAAEKWKTEKTKLPREIQLTAKSGPLDLDIYDDSFSTTTSTIMIYDDEYNNDSLESVSVYLKLKYFNR